MKNNYYYNIKDDIEKYPDAWAVFAWSGRSTGKTYSTLKYMLDEGRRFIFLKRSATTRIPISDRQRKPRSTQPIHLNTKGVNIANSNIIKQNIGCRSMNASNQ